MITDEMVEKAALAALNGARAKMGGRPLTSFDGMKFNDAEAWRAAGRAALEAVAADIRNAAIEEAQAAILDAECNPQSMRRGWHPFNVIEALKPKVTP